MKNLVRLTLLFFGTALIFSCVEDDNQPHAELSEEVQSYLAMKFGNSKNSMEALSGPINRSFNGMMNNFGPMAGGRTLDDSVKSDTTIIDDYTPWVSCATINETTDDEGFTTIITDYGDGCVEGDSFWSYLMFGKSIQTYRSSFSAGEDGSYDDEYVYNMVYENMGGEYYDSSYTDGVMKWTVDGFSNYSGESHYNQRTEEFSGFYEYDSEFDQTWDTYSYYSKSIGKSSYDQNGSSTEGTSEYNSSFDSYYYKSTILKPLVYNYKCMAENSDDSAALTKMAYWIYVSGIESISFTENGKSHSFQINYGDGDCDSIVEITENGKTYEVDMFTIWNNAFAGDTPTEG